MFRVTCIMFGRARVICLGTIICFSKCKGVRFLYRGGAQNIEVRYVLGVPILPSIGLQATAPMSLLLRVLIAYMPVSHLPAAALDVFHGEPENEQAPRSSGKEIF